MFSNSSDIVKGKFNYDQCFNSFVGSTTQKKDTATLLSNVAKGFKELGLMKHDDKEPMRVADVGCANAAASLLFLEAINHPHGYSYQGIDISKNYVKQAQTALRSTALIRDCGVTEGDALCGTLSNTLFSKGKFDLVLVSHIAYYLKNDEEHYKQFLIDMRQLLSAGGVVFFMHGNSHAYLLSTYSKNSSDNHTPFVKTHALLEQYSEKLAFKSTSIDFVSKLHFEPLDDQLWEEMEKTENYKLLQNRREVISTLEKLSIVINRHLSDLEEEGKLHSFIKDAKEIITQNGGFLYLHTHFQVIVSNECKVSLELITEQLKNALKKHPELMIDDSQLMQLNQLKTKPVNVPAFY